MIKTLFILLTFVCLSASYSVAQEVQYPNVITPNSDGINDVFKTISVDVSVENLRCTIFNRWGNLMYEYFGINGTWDGRDHGGHYVPSGVYYYTVEYSTSDGISNTKTGMFHVVREE